MPSLERQQHGERDVGVVADENVPPPIPDTHTRSKNTMALSRKRGQESAGHALEVIDDNGRMGKRRIALPNRYRD